MAELCPLMWPKGPDPLMRYRMMYPRLMHKTVNVQNKSHAYEQSQKPQLLFKDDLTISAKLIIVKYN